VGKAASLGAGLGSSEGRRVEQGGTAVEQAPSAHDPEVDSLHLFLREVSRYPLLTAAEEIDLAKRIERGERGAKDRMINSNLRLVVSLAKRCQGRDVPLLDLIQEGILGLIRATEKFDWRQGNKFSTYATWWIREAIERGIANRARMIRMPVHLVERQRAIKRAERSLVAELGRPPTAEELAATSNLPLERVKEVLAADHTVTSLDEPVGEDGSGALEDLLASEELQPPEEVEINFRKEMVRKALFRLSRAEREVVSLRFGIAGDQAPKTLDEVMRCVGLSRHHVRVLESRALARLAATPEMTALQEGA
jgi:RNA polymerase primary sigma factor